MFYVSISQPIHKVSMVPSVLATEVLSMLAPKDPESSHHAKPSSSTICPEIVSLRREKEGKKPQKSENRNYTKGRSRHRLPLSLVDASCQCDWRVRAGADPPTGLVRYLESHDAAWTKHTVGDVRP